MPAFSERQREPLLLTEPFPKIQIRAVRERVGKRKWRRRWVVRERPRWEQRAFYHYDGYGGGVVEIDGWRYHGRELFRSLSWESARQWTSAYLVNYRRCAHCGDIYVPQFHAQVYCQPDPVKWRGICPKEGWSPEGVNIAGIQ